MDGRKQVTVPETVTLGEKEHKAPFPLKEKGPNDDDDAIHSGSELPRVSEFSV